MADATASARARDQQAAQRARTRGAGAAAARPPRSTPIRARGSRGGRWRCSPSCATRRARGWVNQFLQEYRLNTQEGVALLSPRRGVPARARSRDRRQPDRRQARRGRLALAQGQGQFDPGQHRDLGAGDRPRADQRQRAGERAQAADRAHRRAVRAPGRRRGDADDGRDLRHGPQHRRGDRADAQAREQGLHRQLRHARRGGADLPRRRALFRILRGCDPRGRQGGRRRPFDLGQAVGAPSALRGRAIRSLRAGADRAGRGAGDAGGQPRHPLHHRRRGDRAARDEPRHHRGGRRPARAQGLGRARHGDPGLWQARPADRRLGRRARREDQAADRGAARQGRLLGHRDQAHPGAGPCRLSAVHPQGGDRRLLSRLREGHAGGEEHLSRPSRPTMR